MMLGEIRDKETADIAIRAALMCHLVLATLQTYSAIGAITRLVDMAFEPLLIANTLVLTALHRLRVGEQTAQRGDMARKASAILEFASKNKIDRLMTLLNPIATIVLGVIVASLVGAVMLGILSVNELAK